MIVVSGGVAKVIGGVVCVVVGIVGNAVSITKKRLINSKAKKAKEYQEERK